MTKIEQLVKRFNFVRKMWIESRNETEAEEWYNKMLLVEKEIKAFKARKGGSELGSEVMAKYIGFGEKRAEE